MLNSISGGELFERVVADDFTLTEKDCIIFMRQICEGVDYMHKNLVVHLDLKVSKSIALFHYSVCLRKYEIPITTFDLINNDIT